MSNQGVQGHSEPHMYNQYVIFAVGDVLRQQQFKAWALDNKIGFKELVGSYKGVVEHSFIMNYETFLSKPLELWEFIKQEESVLILEKGVYLGGGKWYRPAYLRYFDVAMETKRGPTMRWRQVNREYALAQDSWTYDPSQELYFVAEEEK